MLFLKLSLGCTGLLALFETLFHCAPSFTTTSTTSMVEFSQCLRNDVIRHAFQMGLKSKVIPNSTTFHFLHERQSIKNTPQPTDTSPVFHSITHGIDRKAIIIQNPKSHLNGLLYHYTCLCTIHTTKKVILGFLQSMAHTLSIIL